MGNQYKVFTMKFIKLRLHTAKVLWISSYLRKHLKYDAFVVYQEFMSDLKEERKLQNENNFITKQGSTFGLTVQVCRRIKSLIINTKFSSLKWQMNCEKSKIGTWWFQIFITPKTSPSPSRNFKSGTRQRMLKMSFQMNRMASS